MSYYGENGLKIYCDNGLLAETDECPCFECGEFDKYPIVYVDKYASGTGDGLSLANAYTSIQDAINDHPIAEIQITGYGESNCYPPGKRLVDCVYLKGVNRGSGDMWIDGGGSGNGIDGRNQAGVLTQTTKLENINVKNCEFGFYRCNLSTFETCISKYNTDDGFLLCGYSNFLNCSSNNNTSSGFQDCDYCTFTNCNANNNNGGFVVSSYGMFLNCTASYNLTHGFSGSDNCTFTNCSTNNNYYCGFTSDVLCVYVACSSINDCTSGEPSCTPGDPSYECDTV